MIGPQAKPGGLTFRYKAVRPMPPTMRILFCARGRRICGLVSRLFVASPRGVQKQVFLGVDNTTSIASIIPDDADDAMHAGDAKQGAESEGEMQGKQE